MRMFAGYRKTALLAAAGGLAAFTASGADAARSVPGVLAYLNTSSNENGDARSTWGFNAVDGNRSSAWCTDNRAIGQRLVLGFMKAETATHIAVIPGMLLGSSLNRNYARVRELEINDGHEKRLITLKDEAELQEVTLEPPMTLRQFSMVIRDLYAGENHKDRACISEIVLRNGPMALTGEGIAKQAKRINPKTLALVGPWVDNPSAPERHLTLALDGTLLWLFEPIMDGTPADFAGSWELDNGRLHVKPKNGGKPVVLKVGLDKVAGKQGAFKQLTLDGRGGHEKLPGQYQPALPPVH
jgi:hypothetical protein